MIISRIRAILTDITSGHGLYQSLTRLLQGQEVQSIIDTDIIYPEVKGAFQKEILGSYRESGEGRFDLQLEPRDYKRKGYIIEFKVAKNQTEQALAGAAKDAVRQIRDRGYAEDMEYRGITDIGFFGIAFHGKRVACEYQEK